MLSSDIVSLIDPLELGTACKARMAELPSFLQAKALPRAPGFSLVRHTQFVNHFAMKLRPLLLVAAGGFFMSSAHAQLTATDVEKIIGQAVTRAVAISPNSVIAVTDREGDVLGVWTVRGGEPTDLEVSSCVSKAGTASYLSSNENAFTSRTAGFIIQQHFPPGVRNTSPGPLVGVGLSNLFFSDINKFRKPGSLISFGSSPGGTIVPVFGTSLDGSPGGVPLYKDGKLVGGIGVTGDGVPGPLPGVRSQNPFIFIPGYDKDEDVALAGQHAYAPAKEIRANNVYINGISLAYVESSTQFASTINLRGNAATDYPIQAAPPPFPYPNATFAGVSGQIRQPIVADPLPGTINGQPRLTAAEVASVINFAADRVRTTRAGIRLPIGVRMEAFLTVVNNPNQPGVAPTVLGAFRTGEATLFSWDVAVQKARTSVFFSTNKLAMSTRTVGFLAQSFYPPGLDVQPPGPFNGLQERFSGLLPAGAGLNPVFAPNPNLPNGITIFPGGFPLYRNGQLVGAIGISGDGVDQDDIVGASGTQDFLAANEIRADQFSYNGARLPYAKFPRDPNGAFVVDASPLMPIIHSELAASGDLANLSTRGIVGTGENQLVGGFIISGTEPKKVIVRAVGPSLAQAGVNDALGDPTLELRDSSGALIASNANWRDAHATDIEASGIAPTNDFEAAIVQTLAPGAYTTVVSGENGSSGIGLVELYDLSANGESKLINLSTRGFVGTGNDLMIGGFIVGNFGSVTVVVRGIGPSLAETGITTALADPTLEVRDINGTLVAANDNWKETQEEDLRASSLAPIADSEAAILTSLSPGPYTAIVQGSGGSSGIGLVEVYNLR
jgi:uncharacterized protein GlcG (DUF336 family)